MQIRVIANCLPKQWWSSTGNSNSCNDTDSFADHVSFTRGIRRSLQEVREAQQQTSTLETLPVQLGLLLRVVAWEILEIGRFQSAPQQSRVTWILGQRFPQFISQACRQQFEKCDISFHFKQKLGQ